MQTIPIIDFTRIYGTENRTRPELGCMKESEAIEAMTRRARRESDYRRFDTQVRHLIRTLV